MTALLLFDGLILLLHILGSLDNIENNNDILLVVYNFLLRFHSKTTDLANIITVIPLFETNINLNYLFSF